MTVVINMHKNIHIHDMCHDMIMKVSCQSNAHFFFFFYSGVALLQSYFYGHVELI